MVTTTDFKKGLRLLVDGEPYSLEDYAFQSPSARGASTLVRCKLRHIVSGAFLERTWKAGEKFDEPDIGFRQIQFLYDDGDACHFMETQSYDQFAIPDERIEDLRPWLSEGLQLQAVYWNGNPAGINLPQYVEAEVESVGAGSKGDMQSGKSLKDATLTNGVGIKVPLYVEAGERVVVDPRAIEFVRRAQR